MLEPRFYIWGSVSRFCALHLSSMSDHNTSNVLMLCSYLTSILTKQAQNYFNRKAWFQTSIKEHILPTASLCSRKETWCGWFKGTVRQPWAIEWNSGIELFEVVHCKVQSHVCRNIDLNLGIQHLSVSGEPEREKKHLLEPYCIQN